MSLALLTTTDQATAGMTAAVAASDDVSPVTLPGGLRISTASIADPQAGLEAGDFTSVELVEAYLARIDELN